MNNLINPYPGLRPFKSEEARFYVGREIVQKQTALRVDLSPLTVLFARSGIGKSSFLTCRFIPSIQDNRYVYYINEWGSDDSDKLIENAINSLSNMQHDSRQVKPLLVLDQFEDVFKINYKPERLWESIAAVANIPDAPVHVLISMREEWLGAWGDATDYLPEALNTTVRLAPLSESDVIRAIIRPAMIEGSIRATEELAYALMKDVTKPNVFGLGDKYVELGLLQLVCHRLWEDANVKGGIMNLDLYNHLGGADRMIREYVWRELGSVGESESQFSSYDRVLLAGLTRYFILAPGVKSIMTPDSMVRKLRITDLGIAGPAVLKKVGGSKGEKYMETLPEKRGEPPPLLKEWIADLFKKGTQAGFLKEQTGSLGTAHLYELTHDSLGGVFQEFSFEFERWISKRVGLCFGILFAGLFVLPYFIYEEILIGFQVALQKLAFLVAFMIAYVVFVWIFMKIFRFIYGIIAHPVIRWLCKGKLPLKRLDKTS